MWERIYTQLSTDDRQQRSEASDRCRPRARQRPEKGKTASKLTGKVGAGLKQGVGNVKDIERGCHVERRLDVPDLLPRDTGGWMGVGKASRESLVSGLGAARLLTRHDKPRK